MVLNEAVLTCTHNVCFEQKYEMELFNDRYECHSFLDGITPIHTNMTITNRVKITISLLRLHAASSVRIPTSTHSF